MQRRQVNSSLERQFLIAMITSKSFLAQAYPVVDTALLETTPFREVAKWCLLYFQEYGEAPGRQIEAIYHSWLEQGERDAVQEEAIYDLLEFLSEQHGVEGDLNVPYLLDEMGKYLSIQKIRRLRDDLEYHLMQGDENEASRVIREYSSVKLGVGVGIKALTDDEAWRRAFDSPLEPLIPYPGDAGRFLNNALTRDALIGIQGPEKRGKTWWCIEFAIRALRNHKKVALFEVGDLSEGQVLLRIGVRLSGRPLWRASCGDIHVPMRVTRVSDNGEQGGPLVDVETRVVRCRRPVTYQSSEKARRKFMRGCGIPASSPYIMISCHPNSSINVRGIEGILDQWEREEGFIPDIIVVDYADILAPEDARLDARHQVNDTWKALRRLSQERRCLVIAPTQADAASYDVQTQTMKNFSEDKRKLAHVTGMLGLNQTEQEKQIGVMRLNWLILREQPFHTYTCLVVGQCLALGRPFCCATL